MYHSRQIACGGVKPAPTAGTYCPQGQYDSNKMDRTLEPILASSNRSSRKLYSPLTANSTLWPTTTSTVAFSISAKGCDDENGLGFGCRRHGSRLRNGDNSVFCSENQPGKHKLRASEESRTSADLRGIEGAPHA